MHLLFVAAELFFLKGSYALPLGSHHIAVRSNSSSSNTTADVDPAWVPAPTERGTIQLVIGCLTTLWLCAWTAYHPEIHSRHRKSYRVYWTLAAIIAPELILHRAVTQRWRAGRLREEVNKLGGRASNGFNRASEVSRSKSRGSKEAEKAPMLKAPH